LPPPVTRFCDLTPISTTSDGGLLQISEVCKWEM
jgi:hypothetical protein